MSLITSVNIEDWKAVTRRRIILNLQTMCIHWTGSTNYSPKNRKGGYGVVSYKGKRWFTHRFTYECYYGLIPLGMFVCHSCDVRVCINPKHLFLGTANDNNKDMKQKGRAGFGGTHLTDDDVQFIRENALRGQGRREEMGKLQHSVLAEWFGMHRGNIGYILRGQTFSRLRGGVGCP